jgi:hypothetical protein
MWTLGSTAGAEVRAGNCCQPCLAAVPCPSLHSFGRAEFSHAIQENRNWKRGHAVSFLGIFVFNFRYSVASLSNLTGDFQQDNWCFFISKPNLELSAFGGFLHHGEQLSIAGEQIRFSCKNVPILSNLSQLTSSVCSSKLACDLKYLKNSKPFKWAAKKLKLQPLNNGLKQPAR